MGVPSIRMHIVTSVRDVHENGQANECLPARLLLTREFMLLIPATRRFRFTRIGSILWLVVLCALGMPLCAQEWKRDHRAWYSYVQATKAFGMTRLIVLDTCTQELWAVLGERIWRSKDSGGTWHHMPIPNLQDYRPLSQLVANGCNIYYQWEDKAANFEFRIFSYDRNEDNWRELRPLGTEKALPANPKVGVYDSVVVLVGGLRGRYNDLYSSKNLGKDWDSTVIPNSFTSSLSEPLFEVRKGVISIACDSVYIEYDARSSKIHVVDLPGRPIAYRYFDSATIVATVERPQPNGSTLSLLARTTNRGASWVETDSLVFVNSPRVLRGKRQELDAILMRQQSDIITVVMSTGDVVSTKNGGIDWYYRGNVGRLDALRAPEAFHTDRTGNILIANVGLVCVLPTDLGAMDTLTRFAPSLISVIRMDSCTIIGIGTKSLYRSIDCGKTWQLPAAPADLFEVSNVRTLGTHFMSTERVSAGDAQVHFISGEHQVLYRLNHAEAATHQRHVFGFPQFYEFNVIYPRYVNLGGPPVQLVGDTTYLHSTHVDVAGPAMQSRKPIGSGVVRASAFTLSSGSEWIAVSDSVYFSSNRAETWTTALSAGLPRDSKGRILEASHIVRLSPRTLLLGLRGLYSNDGTDTTILRPGGLYRSDDNGETWTRSDVGMGKQSYIWYITKLDESTVLCAAGQVLADTTNRGSNDEDRYNQSGATVMRSSDAGRTWSMVFNEPRTRPAFWGRREMIATSPTRILYASIEDGVLESTDAGQSWHTLGETPLYFHFIQDIDIDKNGTIYAATEKGLYSFTPTTSTVDDENDQGRFASVWAYPTPARGQLTVRINHAHLTKSAPKLTLVNIYGMQIADLSHLIGIAPGTQEFNISVEDMAPGIYLLALQHAGGSEWCKIMVQQ